MNAIQQIALLRKACQSIDMWRLSKRDWEEILTEVKNALDSTTEPPDDDIPAFRNILNRLDAVCRETGCPDGIKYEEWIKKLDKELIEYRKAFGLLTTLHPQMVIDTTNPVDMAKQICRVVENIKVEWDSTTTDLVDEFNEMKAQRDASRALADSWCDAHAKVVKERDEALAKLRSVAQTIIAEIGADGPENAGEAADRMVEAHAVLKEKLAAAQKEIDDIYAAKPEPEYRATGVFVERRGWEKHAECDTWVAAKRIADALNAGGGK